MKKRHQEYVPMQPQKKKSHKGAALIIVVIAIVLIYFYVSSSGGPINFKLPFNFTFGNSNSTSSDPQIQACIDNINKCGKIINSKYDATVTILQSTKTNSTAEANNFLKTWGTSSQTADINSYGAGSTAILVATRFNNPDGSKKPLVFVCKPDGGLTSRSTEGLC